MPSRTIQLTLLGGFRLVVDGRIVVLPHALQRLVAFVGLSKRATRAQVVGALWPDSTEQRALANLRTALWRMQRPAASVLVARGDTLGLTDGVEVDVHDTLGSVTACPELLPGWSADWVLLERERLRQLCLRALESRAVNGLRAGRCPEALDAALAAVRAEPLRESSHRLLMEVHLADGNYGEALRAYEHYRRTVCRVLDVLPSPTMQELVRGMRTPVGAGGRGQSWRPG